MGIVVSCCRDVPWHVSTVVSGSFLLLILPTLPTLLILLILLTLPHLSIAPNPTKWGLLAPHHPISLSSSHQTELSA